MAEVFIVRKGGATRASMAALRKAGIVVVEVDDPSEARLVRSTAEIDAGALLRAAMVALIPSSDSKYHPADVNRTRFVVELTKALCSDGAAPLRFPHDDMGTPT